MPFFHRFVVLFCLGLLFLPLSGQDLPAFDSNLRNAVVDSLARYLDSVYVFADKGHEAATLIRANRDRGVYGTLTDPAQFSARITADLQGVTHDLHLHLDYNPQRIASEREILARPGDPSAAVKANRARNSGFREVIILPGNIGYLRLDSFDNSPDAFRTAAGAMAFLSLTEAIIFDLRYNGGGDPAMLQFLISYLFDANPRILNKFWIRQPETEQQFWTLPTIPGERRPEVEVFVLTSSSTFSCAEEFSYDLQAMQRATLVGETTGGGAHPVNVCDWYDQFRAYLPYGRAINPYTGTNWEGVGVHPDIAAPADQALDRAQLEILSRFEAREKDEMTKAALQWAMDDIRCRLSPFVPDPKALRDCVGTFGPRTITLEKGVLFYQRTGRARVEMIPMAEDLYAFAGSPMFHLRAIRENGKVVALQGEYDSGSRDVTMRNP